MIHTCAYSRPTMSFVSRTLFLSLLGFEVLLPRFACSRFDASFAEEIFRVEITIPEP